MFVHTKRLNIIVRGGVNSDWMYFWAGKHDGQKCTFESVNCNPINAFTKRPCFKLPIQLNAQIERYYTIPLIDCTAIALNQNLWFDTLVINNL